MGFREMGAALLLAGVLLPFKGHAADPDWYVEEGVGWRSRASALDTSLLVSVDGRVINPVQTGQQGGNRPGAQGSPISNNFKSVLKLSVNSIVVSHETQLDSKRNALRVLDVLTNNDSKERRVRVEFRTQMRANSQVKYNGFIGDSGEVLENGNAVPENTHAIILLSELPDSPALPLFVWGDRTAAWPVSIREVGNSVRLGYEGVIKPGEKVALFHWLATAGLDKQVKLERTFDLFLKNGKLIDPMIDAEILPYVVNFKPESLVSGTTIEPTLKSFRLAALDKLCGRLNTKREDKEVLWMSKDEIFRGTVEAGKLNFSTGEHTQEIDWKDVAAVRGGGGRGREHRLYLRNGSVWDGQVKFSDAKLTGDIGTMALDSGALELLLCRKQPEDGKPADGAQGFVQTLSGRHFWVKTSGAFGATLVSHFGVLPVEADEVWVVRRKTEAPYDQTVTLMDGSRIQGVLTNSLMTAEVAGMESQTFSVSELLRWGKMEAWMEEEDAAAGAKSKAVPPTRYCWLRDGSFLVGTLTDASLVLHTRQEDVTLKSQEIARITPVESDSTQLTVELLNGSKIRGRLLQGSVSWQLGKHVISLPVGQITELVRKDQP